MDFEKSGPWRTGLLKGDLKSTSVNGSLFARKKEHLLTRGSLQKYSWRFGCKKQIFLKPFTSSSWTLVPLPPPDDLTINIPYQVPWKRSLRPKKNALNESVSKQFKPLDNGASSWYVKEKSMQSIYCETRKDLAAIPIWNIKCCKAAQGKWGLLAFTRQDP